MMFETHLANIVNSAHLQVAFVLVQTRLNAFKVRNIKLLVDLDT